MQKITVDKLLTNGEILRAPDLAALRKLVEEQCFKKFVEEIAKYVVKKWEEDTYGERLFYTLYVKTLEESENANPNHPKS